MLLKAKSDPKNLRIDDLVRMNTNAVALISHTSQELAQRRHKTIKPHLHRDYIELCSKEVPAGFDKVRECASAARRQHFFAQAHFFG
jgi:hypothetical protein